ncbi:hypothetical protein [Desulfobulbus propionicus]|jgi:hypothetical protein
MDMIWMVKTEGWRILVGVGLMGAILAFGCTPVGTWTKPGTTQAIFDNDMAECRRQATVSNQSTPFDEQNGLERLDRRERLIRGCMEAKGYQFRVKEPK